MKTTPKKEDNPKTSCVAHYVRAAGPATRVAGSNPLELVSALLSKNLRETSIHFSSNYLLHLVAGLL